MIISLWKRLNGSRKKKYEAIKEQMPAADDETLAILLAINSLSTQLSREIEFDDKEKNWKIFVARP